MASANRFAAAAIAAVAACAFISIAPQISAQEQSPAIVMARMVCFDEIRTFQAAHAREGKTAAETAAAVDDVLKSFVPANEDRTHALTAIDAIKKSVSGPGSPASDRDQLAFVFCAATVGDAADGGMRDLSAFKSRWVNDRATKFKLAPAPESGAAPNESRASTPPPGAPQQLIRYARSVCANEMKAYEEVAGKSATDDIVLTFASDAEPRNHVLDTFDAMASRAAGSDADLRRLSVSACVATVGAMWSIGMRSFGEFNGHWAGRGRARYALAGHPVQPTARGCIWVDWEADGMGVPATLRNDCEATIDLRFCVVEPKAGTPSETIACEKGRSRFERIEAKGGVRTTLTEGTRLSWVPCKAPLQPVETNQPGATFTATCK